jgi:hypothetical protein
MLQASGFRALTCCCAVVLVAAGYGCSEIARENPEGEAGEAASSAGAGGRGGASMGGAALAGAGTSAVDDFSYAGNASGDTLCRSGETRCHGQLGFQRCTPDGTWGASQSCGGYSDNGTSSYCAVVDDGGGPWAACVDPACWWWLRSGVDLGEGRAGVCVGADQVRPCQASVLTTPRQCEGVCRRVAELDGRVLGYCDASCADGDRECLTGPLYRECVKGRWSPKAQSCADGAECQPLATSAHPDIKCGGACEPGASRCSGDGSSIESCDEKQEWQPASPCALGHCVQSGAQAQCQTECKPNERACAFDGAASELVCSERGLWSEPIACDAGAMCRVGTAGALGCMRCVGPNAPSGNAWGVTDSHCDASGVAECGAGNDYAAGTPCVAGQICVELARGAATLAYCR